MSVWPAASGSRSHIFPTRADCSLEPGTSLPGVAFLSTHFVPAIASALPMLLTVTSRLNAHSHSSSGRMHVHSRGFLAEDLHPASVAWRHGWEAAPQAPPLFHGGSSLCLYSRKPEHPISTRLAERVCPLCASSPFPCAPPRWTLFKRGGTIPLNIYPGHYVGKKQTLSIV